MSSGRGMDITGVPDTLPTELKDVVFGDYLTTERKTTKTSMTTVKKNLTIYGYAFDACNARAPIHEAWMYNQVRQHFAGRAGVAWDRLYMSATNTGITERWAVKDGVPDKLAMLANGIVAFDRARPIIAVHIRQFLTANDYKRFATAVPGVYEHYARFKHYVKTACSAAAANVPVFSNAVNHARMMKYCLANAFASCHSASRRDIDHVLTQFVVHSVRCDRLMKTCEFFLWPLVKPMLATHEWRYAAGALPGAAKYEALLVYRANKERIDREVALDAALHAGGFTDKDVGAYKISTPYSDVRQRFQLYYSSPLFVATRLASLLIEYHRSGAKARRAKLVAALTVYNARFARTAVCVRRTLQQVPGG